MDTLRNTHMNTHMDTHSYTLGPGGGARNTDWGRVTLSVMVELNMPNGC